MSENIRPLTFEDFTGQADSIAKLKVAIKSAQVRKAPMAHVLMNGPAGVGKTTLAQIIANSLNVEIMPTIGNNIKKDIDLFNMVKSVTREDKCNILFIDEIHTIAPAAQNNLLTVMEDFAISIRKGNHSQRWSFAPITLIGATTHPGSLLKPVYDRFDHKIVLEPYTVTELQKIVKFTVSRLSYINSITDKAAFIIAQRSRGIARIATKYVNHVQDKACEIGVHDIDEKLVKNTFTLHNIDEKGLNKKVDIKVLEHLFKIYPNAIGADNMAQLLDEDPRHISGIVEPSLFKLGYIQRGHGGRTITPNGIAYLREKGHISLKDCDSAMIMIST